MLRCGACDSHPYALMLWLLWEPIAETAGYSPAALSPSSLVSSALGVLSLWPQLVGVFRHEGPSRELGGMPEGSVAREEWHGHVTALSVAPRISMPCKGGFFVDLLVRVSNQVAVNMSKQLGYSMYRIVIEKALSRDTEKKSIIPLPHPVRPEDLG
ncbi:unnamed protein product [Nyctereutes procyonoides]|uniref:(raccoon dog) hypothetical protein n=1 Tax=Nyctereutes procyonoides TaxID=34880 RepID=A0A811YFG0_NYCPR|nr:unnamed protein product [Nyctereutes procyonoides]